MPGNYSQNTDASSAWLVIELLSLWFGTLTPAFAYYAGFTLFAGACKMETKLSPFVVV